MSEPVQVGDVIAGAYRVERVLGRGGMGVVVAATHLSTGVQRAVKLMLPEAARRPRAAKSFLSEAWTACALKSEHVARVMEVGEHLGLPFMAMELLTGSDLAAVLAERRVLPAREAALHALQICEALAEAHALGVVHRDIKPENVFLARREGGGGVTVKVLDFGLAKVAAAAFPPGDATPRCTLVGSPSFMSPEQVNGEELDGRSDIWSVGVLLYRMLTSQLPFRPAGRVGLAGLLVSILQADPDPPSQLMPSIPQGLDAIVLRCLEKDRARRFAGVVDLAIALAPFAPADAARTLARIRRVALRNDAHDAPAAPPSSPLSPRLRELPGAADAVHAASAPAPATLSAAVWGPASIPPPPPSAPPSTPRTLRSWVLAAATGTGLFGAAFGLGVELPRGDAALSPAVAEAGIAAQVDVLRARLAHGTSPYSSSRSQPH